MFKDFVAIVPVAMAVVIILLVGSEYVGIAPTIYCVAFSLWLFWAVVHWIRRFVHVGIQNYQESSKL